MKVGIDGRELLRNKITGIGRFLSIFLKHAPKIKPDWEFIIFGNQNTFFPFDCPNLKKIFIPEKYTIFWDQVTLPKFLKKEKATIFFSPYYKAPIISCCPTVTTIHDLTPFIKFKNREYPLRFIDHPRPVLSNSSVLKYWSVFLAKKANKIITVSNHSKNDIIRFLKIPGKKIKVVYEGIEEKFKPIEIEMIKKVKEKHGIRGKYLLYIGNFEPHKNVDGLIKAYAGISPGLQAEYFLVIAGEDKKNFPRIYKLAENLGLRERIIFPGFIQDEDLPAIYSGAEIFILPSFYEGFGLPPVEAMACGTAVISSSTASLPEILEKSALYFNPYKEKDIRQRISEVLNDNKLRQMLAESGKLQAKKYEATIFSATLLEELRGF